MGLALCIPMLGWGEFAETMDPGIILEVGNYFLVKNF